MAQQFQVPQFIEHEARLIGPLSVKQTAVLALLGAVLFIFWFLVEKWLFFLLAFPFSFIALLIAFMKINGLPVLDFFTAFFSFFISPQLFIWQNGSLRAPTNGLKMARLKFSGALQTRPQNKKS
jgi:uncharacterized ion transporter superfamily protein YfcC